MKEVKKIKQVTYEELTVGDKIKHHMWGVITFKRQLNGDTFLFKSAEHGDLDLVNTGLKHWLVR